MTDDLVQGFHALNVWERGGRRAPHKPLLALWAIGRCLGRRPRLAPYEVVDEELGLLLRRFGPYRRRARTDYPFWRMRNDLIWELDRPHLVRTTSSDDAHIGDLRRHAICGGFTPAVFSSLQEDPRLAARVAENLVAGHFPLSLRDAVLEATWIPTDVQIEPESQGVSEFVEVRRRRGDTAFRSRILNAYADRCAVCAFAGRLDDTPLAIEAAHIRWHEADGPSVVPNGLALCALHHKLFDAGAFTLLPELRVVVAHGVVGAGVDDALGRFDGEPLRATPKEGLLRPAPSYLRVARPRGVQGAVRAPVRTCRAQGRVVSLVPGGQPLKVVESVQRERVDATMCQTATLLQAPYTRLKATGRGKHIGPFSYYHLALVLGGPEATNELAATRRLCDVGEAGFNVVKLDTGCRVSFLVYEDFEVPFPALLAAVTCNVARGTVRRTDYSARRNPPILHRKELLLPKGHPLVPRALRLTERFEQRGAFVGTATIGTRLGWQRRLDELGLDLTGRPSA